MTQHPSFDLGDVAEENEYDLDNAETEISGLLKGSLSFPGAQYFNEIMQEEMRPKKIVKFRAPRKLGSDY
jgi:hypothetical protein